MRRRRNRPIFARHVTLPALRGQIIAEILDGDVRTCILETPFRDSFLTLLIPASDLEKCEPDRSTPTGAGEPEGCGYCR